MSKPLTADQLRGNWATVLLPIDAQDRIDMLRLADELDVLLASGVQGIYTGGTAGEFYNLTEDEFDAINALCANRCRSAAMPFQIGVSHMSPWLSLQRLSRARHLSPGAVQVVLPDWFPPSENESIAFLSRMAEVADPIGLVLYNPPHAKVTLTPAQFGNLARQVSGLIGVKVADGDASWYAAMRANAERLSIFVPGHRLATGILSGAHGSYSNMACLNPAASERWYQQILTNMDAAWKTQRRIQMLMDTHLAPLAARDGLSNQAIDKLLAAIGGWADIGTRLRWPYRGADIEEVGRLRPIAREILPEFFE
jgi:dihydrodipicolinate synthase/N-acetylneuraminate lyase